MKKTATRASRPAAKAVTPAAATRQYLAALPAPVRRRVQAMRTIVRGAAPEAVEHFSYGIPGFTLGGKPFVWCAAFKAHTSLYPMTAAVRKQFASELKGYGTSTGTIRFPLDEPLPASLVKKLVKARLAEMRAARKGSTRAERG